MQPSEDFPFDTYLDDQVIISKVMSGVEIELNHAKRNTEVVVEISNGTKYPIVVDLQRLKGISKEARDHFAMRGREPMVTAVALVIRGPISRVIGNYFINLSGPVVPTRLFTNLDKAIGWAKGI